MMGAAWLAGSQELVKLSTVNRGVFDGREGTDCELLRWWFKFQTDAAKMGIPLRVVWGVRDRAQQTELFNKGHSKARFGQSAHNYGLALDVIHMARAWDGMPSEGWEILGKLGFEAARKIGLKVEWGGDWGRTDKRLGWDPAHWQVANWRKHPSYKPI